MLYYIVEEHYRDFPWCRDSLKSLLDEAKKRRIQIDEISSATELDLEDGSQQVVFVLGATQEWLEITLQNIASARAYPIALANTNLSSLWGKCSIVANNAAKSVRIAISYLRSLGRNRTALYGVNPDSSSDPEKETAFVRLVGDNGDVFRIDSSYKAMFNSLMDRIGEYDSIICCNDYASVSLVYGLKKAGILPPRDIYIVGLGSAYISKLCRPSITTVSDDYEHFGTGAMAIYSMMKRMDFISTIDLRLETRLEIRETTGNRPCSAGELEAIPHTANRNLFYNDEMVVHLRKLERLFTQCDEIDFQLLESLMENNTYAYISQQCYISETAAKYRIGKMKDICGVETRAELTAFLKTLPD